MEELKHVIALLLEDAKRLQQIEPNAGTNARIAQANEALESVFSSIEQRSFSGKTIELSVNGAPVAFLKTEGSVAADYLLFLDGVLRALLLDRASLEKEARASGKTMQHDNFDSLGSISVTDAKGL